MIASCGTSWAKSMTQMRHFSRREIGKEKNVKDAFGYTGPRQAAGSICNTRGDDIALDKTFLERFDNRLRLGVHMEFLVDMSDVVSDCLRANKEFGGDLIVSKSIDEK